MNVSELLNSPIGQSIVNTVSEQLGMNKKEASGAINLVIPAILAGMNKNAQSSQGAESLNKALESKHDGSLLDNLAEKLQANSVEIKNDGEGILGHVFGAKKQAVEQGVSQKVGISQKQTASLLAILAPIVMAYLGKQKSQTKTGAGGLSDLLGGLLGGVQPKSKPKQRKSGGGLMDVVGGMLDKDGDGNIVDDLLGGLLGGKR